MQSRTHITCPETGLKLKIRPDKIIYNYFGEGKPLYCDVKKTASISEWTSEQIWKNPLFTFGYGFTAAYYLYVGSIFEDVELTEYAFPIVQSSAEMGRYPADVFMITKDDLIELGFWDDMLGALRYFKSCQDNNSFKTMSYFPRFEHLRKEEFSDEVEVIFEGENNE